MPYSQYSKPWEVTPDMLRTARNAGLAATDATNAALSFAPQRQSFDGSEPKITQTSVGPGRYYGLDEQRRDAEANMQAALRRGDTNAARFSYQASQDLQGQIDKAAADRDAYAAAHPTGMYGISVGDTGKPVTFNAGTPNEISGFMYSGAPEPKPFYMDTRISTPREFATFDAAQAAGDAAALEHATQAARENPQYIQQRALAIMNNQADMAKIAAEGIQKGNDFERLRLDAEMRAATNEHENASRVAGSLKPTGDETTDKQNRALAAAALNTAQGHLMNAVANMKAFVPKAYSAQPLVDPLAASSNGDSLIYSPEIEAVKSKRREVQNIRDMIAAIGDNPDVSGITVGAGIDELATISDPNVLKAKWREIMSANGLAGLSDEIVNQAIQAATAPGKSKGAVLRDATKALMQAKNATPAQSSVVLNPEGGVYRTAPSVAAPVGAQSFSAAVPQAVGTPAFVAVPQAVGTPAFVPVDPRVGHRSRMKYTRPDGSVDTQAYLRDKAAQDAVLAEERALQERRDQIRRNREGFIGSLFPTSGQ